MTPPPAASWTLPGNLSADQKSPIGETPSYVPDTGAWRATSTPPLSSARNVACDCHREPDGNVWSAMRVTGSRGETLDLDSAGVSTSVIG